MFVNRVERTDASILHADLDSFYASVEQRDDPRLRDRPMVVGRGVVLAASYQAKALGVRTAMTGYQARVCCPDLIAVDPRFHAYTAASRAVFSIFADTSPLVEGISIDEAFLDVSGLRRSVGPPVGIAQTLRRRVAEEVGLPITVGVARTKFLAKVASAVAKPDGLLEVSPESELAFLHPLPIERLWGVGRVISARLHGHGVGTVGELAAIPAGTLAALVGSAAADHLLELAGARDPRPVRVGRRRASIGAQHALGRLARSPAELDAVLVALVDRVTRRLRAADRRGRTVVLRLRFDDFARASRSHTLPRPTAGTDAVLRAARDLLRRARPIVAERGLTLIGVAVTDFDSGDAEQLELPIGEAAAPRRGRLAAPADTPAALDGALDRVRDRFGTAAVTRAVLLRRGPEVEVPRLED